MIEICKNGSFPGAIVLHHVAPDEGSPGYLILDRKAPDGGPGWDAWGNQVPEVYPTAPIPMALEGTTEPETWLEPEEMRF